MIESEERMRTAERRLIRRRATARVHPGHLLRNERLPLSLLAGAALMALAANLLLKLPLL